MKSLCRMRSLLLVSLLILVAFAHADAQRSQPDTSETDTVTGPTEGKTSTVRSDSEYYSGTDTTVSVSDSLLKRAVPDSVVQGWKKAPEFAYANDPRYWKRMAEEDNARPNWIFRLLSSDGFRYGIYIILGALLVYAIGRIVSENQLGVFYRGAKRSGRNETEATDEAVTDKDIDRLLKQSIENKEYRQAVRYSYLRTLRRMDQRGLIRYHGQATDQEYLRQISGTVQEAPFRFLTYAYEKVWYGEFGLTEESFRRLIEHFSEFDKIIAG